MDKLRWCMKKWLKITDPSTNLAEAYIMKAEEALLSIPINKVKDWKIATAYYTMYFSLYSLLAKIGIKSENHS